MSYIQTFRKRSSFKAIQLTWKQDTKSIIDFMNEYVIKEHSLMFTFEYEYSTMCIGEIINITIKYKNSSVIYRDFFLPDECWVTNDINLLVVSNEYMRINFIRELDEPECFGNCINYEEHHY